MTLLPVIMAHGNGIAAFRRHEKYWLAHKMPLLVCCPEDDPLKSGHETLHFKKASHAGKDAGERLKLLVEELARRTWDQCVIYEYDSFMLEPTVPGSPGIHGIVFRNDESPKFMAERYANPPWTVDRESFEAMRAVMLKYPRLHEHGYADRWLSALAMLAGVPLFDYEPAGFSRGTIQTSDIPLVNMRIKHEGCFAFHGVKQEWVLKAIEQFWDEAHPSRGQAI